MALLDSLIKMRSGQTTSGSQEPGFLKTLLLATAPGQAYTRVKQDQERRSALRELANTLDRPGGVGAVPNDGSYGPQRPVDRQSALLRYGAITGDPRALGIVSDDNTPAALRLANEYQAALASGDINRVNALAAFAKITDKNVAMNPDGTYVPLPGLPDALSSLEYGKNFGGTQGQKDVELKTNPILAYLEAKAKAEGSGDITPKEQQQSGREEISSLVDDMTAEYAELDRMGGIVNTERQGIENLGARISASGLGNFVGGSFGTEEATVRGNIRSKIPLLMSAIKRATGKSASEVNSIPEMQLLKESVGDPKQSLQTVLKTLADIERNYGLRPATKGSAPVLPKAFDNLETSPTEEVNFQEYFR